MTFRRQFTGCVRIAVSCTSSTFSCMIQGIYSEQHRRGDPFGNCPNTVSHHCYQYHKQKLLKPVLIFYCVVKTARRRREWSRIMDSVRVRECVCVCTGRQLIALNLIGKRVSVHSMFSGIGSIIHICLCCMQVYLNLFLNE